VDPALTKAKQAFATGKTKPIKFRLDQLANLKRGVKEMESELCDAVRSDLGRGAYSTWALELFGLEKQIEHAESNLKKWMKETVVTTPMLVGPGTSKIVPEPLGVILVLGSWNFPLFTTIGPLIDIIAAGNCAVIKGSEISFNTSRAMG
jgi:aldehyde dehydrogenase (NAD+)